MSDRVRVMTLAVLMFLVVGLLTWGVLGSDKRHSASRSTVPIPHINHPTFVRSLDAQSWKKLWRTVPGSSAHTCVNVGTRTTVRSGEFIVGNFVAYIQTWDGTLENSKLAYTPLYPPDYVPGHVGDIPLPTITAQRLDKGSGPIMPVQGISPAWAGDGMFFYATGTVLPERGRWRLTAQLGQNSGCFDLTF
jgi:hypothetical protein